MLRQFKAPHPLFGKPNKPLASRYQERSPYFWWWAYLMRNPDYLECCRQRGSGPLAPLYADFGDVTHDSFKRWWTENERGTRLFGEPPALTRLTELTEKSQWDDGWDRDTVMVVAIPLALDKRRLRKYWGELLKRRHPGKRGRKALSDPEASNALYPLHRNVTVNTLRVQLKVYDAIIENEKSAPRLTRAQIGAELKLVPSAMPSSKDLPKEARDKRNVMTAAVCRHLRNAKAIIENTAYVAEGIARSQFPNSTPQKPAS